jgi:predicted ATP-binding protein involved in virulence
MKHIQKIDISIPHTEFTLNLDVEGKDVIFLGGNGSGKTNVLTKIHKELEIFIVEKRASNRHKKQLESNIALMGIRLTELTESKELTRQDPEYAAAQLKGDLHDFTKQLNQVTSPPIKMTENGHQLYKNYHTKKSIIRFFDASRQVNIDSCTQSISQNELIAQELTSDFKLSSAERFESFLVSYKNLQGQYYLDGQITLHDEVKQWFDKLNHDLQFLFEDTSLELKFTAKEQKFYIHQQGKDAYTLQQLSSGFRAVIAIFADISIKIKLLKLTPENIEGVVLIDEIDAHLHLSLQQKILPFLKNSFPNIQFIVTSHSPFIVSSINDAVIWDLTKKEKVGDVSIFSYENIIESLFHTHSYSTLLAGYFLELEKLMENETPDLEKLQSLLDVLKENHDKMGDESLYFYNKAKVFVSKLKQNKNV